MFIILAPAKGASLVLMTLFHRILEETMLAVCVSELDRVINQVASDGDAHMVGVVLLVMMINHNAGIGDYSITRDVANVSVQKKKDGVGAFGDASTSLHQAMEFFAHCLEPQILEQGILD
jgi:hypothetical protein